MCQARKFLRVCNRLMMTTAGVHLMRLHTHWHHRSSLSPSLHSLALSPSCCSCFITTVIKRCTACDHTLSQ
jgi:hypothetical protein